MMRMEDAQTPTIVLEVLGHLLDDHFPGESGLREKILASAGGLCRERSGFVSSDYAIHELIALLIQRHCAKFKASPPPEQQDKENAIVLLHATTDFLRDKPDSVDHLEHVASVVSRLRWELSLERLGWLAQFYWCPSRNAANKHAP
jgi:hypothetical protein